MKKRRKKKLYYRKWTKLMEPTKKSCDYCGGTVFYCSTYDADCCMQCNIWLTEKCGDPECYFCEARYETPKEAMEVFKFRSEGKRMYKETQKEWAIRHYLFNEKRKKSIRKV